MAEKYGLGRLGFLTLTFADHVLDAREASRRFNSLATHVLKERYGDRIRVIERQKTGRVHFHLLVALECDIRWGVDFVAFEKGVYTSAGPQLRSEWAFWRKTAPLYGFGRVELLPVKSTAEGIARYVGKYIAKHIGQRIEADKGVRLVAYSKGVAKAAGRMAWRSPGADLWRLKVRELAVALGCTSDNYGARFVEWFGSSWAYHLRQALDSIRLRKYPTGEHFLRDFPEHRTGLGWDEIDPRAMLDVCPSDSRLCMESLAKAVDYAFALRSVRAERARERGHT